MRTGDNINNRNLGEVYTPDNIATKMRDMAKENLGDDFEEKFVIWDNCCGTFNLEKPLEGKGELFCSTLKRMDIRKNAKEHGQKFVYDFLNEDVEQLKSLQAMWGAEHKNMPERLVEVLQNENDKPLLFYINPPYVGTGNFGVNNDNKEVDTQQELRQMMKEENMGFACDNTYIQWIYKIIKMKQAYANKKMYFMLISPILYLTSNSYSNFRSLLCSEFKLKDAIMFKSTEFGNLCGRYALSITLWEPGVNDSTQDFKFKMLRNNGDGLKQFGWKTLYNSNGHRGNDVAKEKNSLLDDVEADVTLSSGCRVSNKKKVTWKSGGFGYIFYKGNNVYHNCTDTGIISRPYGDGGGLTITKENLKDALAYFIARTSIGVYNRSWIIDKEEYLRPDTNCEAYRILQENGIIFSLFNNYTHLVGATFNVDNKSIEVKNDWHFMSADMTKRMFTENDLDVPSGIEDRLIVKYLKESIESGYILQSGIDVLKYAQRMFIETYKLREEFDKIEDNKIYQCTRWDAGYYQLKWVLKQLDNERFKEFREIYRKYSDELLEYVYGCKFLKHRPVDMDGKIIM